MPIFLTNFQDFRLENTLPNFSWVALPKDFLSLDLLNPFFEYLNSFNLLPYLYGILGLLLISFISLFIFAIYPVVFSDSSQDQQEEIVEDISGLSISGQNGNADDNNENSDDNNEKPQEVDETKEKELNDKIKEREELNDRHSKAGDDDDTVLENQLELELVAIDEEIEKMKKNLGRN